MSVRIVSVALCCLALIGYFAYHLIVDNHGLRARAKLEDHVAAREGELAGLKAVRQRIERDVALLRAEALDPDMLDERARAVLNFAHPHEIVILKPKSATDAQR